MRNKLSTTVKKVPDGFVPLEPDLTAFVLVFKTLLLSVAESLHVSVHGPTWREDTFEGNDSEDGKHFILPEHLANGGGIFEAVIAKDEIYATVIDAIVKKVFTFGFNSYLGGYVLGAFNPWQLPRLPFIQFHVESLFACCTNRIH